ncbi:MAG TPA: CPBP family intramembrane glutamic endopeptidase [Candidatus Eremiobacteraceae bacterium]|nr:CPBP family intramembrane glutamic endopeptidase [Candidatus Eremiobacteraceae bacterium]
MTGISLASEVQPSTLALFAVLTVVLVAIPVVALLRARVDDPERAHERRIKHARYARTMLILWGISALALYALRLYGLGPADAGVRPPGAPWEYGAGLIVPALFVLVSGGRENISPEYLRKVGRVIPIDASDWVWFVPLSATAGLCEEFLYRGYALTQISALTGSLAAGFFLSCAAFGLAHAYQGRMGIVGTMITGALYAAVFLLTGSIVPCMIGHFVQDIVGGFALSRRMRALQSDRQ